MSHKVADFELVDHGIDNPQYFQGCGTTFTNFEFVETGSGDNPKDALEDVLEQIAMQGFDTEDLEKRILEENESILVDGAFPEEPSALAEALAAEGLMTVEPDPDDFEDDEALEDARQKYDEVLESSETHYMLSIRWNKADD